MQDNAGLKVWFMLCAFKGQGKAGFLHYQVLRTSNLGGGTSKKITLRGPAIK